MRVFKILGGVLPGPVLIFIGKWLDLFTYTNLTSPVWRYDAQNIALGIGAFVAVVLSIGLNQTRKDTLRVLTWIGFGITLVLLAACWGIWFHLGPPGPERLAPTAPTVWRDVWEACFIAGMVFLVATVTVAALSLEEKSTKWIWVLVAIPVLLLIGIGIYVFWWR